MEENQIVDKINKIHSAVPPDFYDDGIKNNFCQRYWHRKRFELVEEMIESAEAKSAILDLGCHGGTLTNHIAGFTKSKVCGVDISENAIKYARGRYPNIEFKVADLNNGIPYPDKTFDLVTCFDVLEHVVNPSALLKEIKRVLKNNGSFIIDIPNETPLFKFIWFFWTKMGGRVWKDAHINHFDAESLMKLFMNNGFVKVKEKKIHLGMLWIMEYKLKNQ